MLTDNRRKVFAKAPNGLWKVSLKKELF